MKRSIPVIILVFLFLFPVSAQAIYIHINFKTVAYLFTTDVIEWADPNGPDITLEFEYVLNARWAFSIRAGYYRTIEDSNRVYVNGIRHWEIGSRWRYYFTNNAPHLFFFGFGFDNRPQDNTITPLGEFGIQLCLKPGVFSLLGFTGYEWHWRVPSANRWVKGVELRVGFCF